MALVLDEQSCMNQVTIEVVVRTTRRYRLRKWLAIRLLVIAAFLLDCGIEFNEPDDSEVERYFCKRGYKWPPF